MTFMLQEPEAPINNATSRSLRRDLPAEAGGGIASRGIQVYCRPAHLAPAGSDHNVWVEFAKNSTGTCLDPFPMNQADGKFLFFPRAWCICLLPSSADNHHE